MRALSNRGLLPISAPVLSNRALGRALLARQLLLARVQMPATEAVEHLVGLQAQASTPPYFGLWSRVSQFDPRELERTLIERETVRLKLMRGTVHLVTVRDALHLRPLVQPAIERGHNGAFRRAMAGVDHQRLATVVRELLADGPMTARALARQLIERGIGEDLAAITNATHTFAPLVQVPPRGLWRDGGQAQFATLESWTGRKLDHDPSIDAVVLRYLRAFGPASALDAQRWSGLSRLKEVLERLAPQLVKFRSEEGRELFDLPDAPRPDGEVPAPPRFLGQFDNVLLSHADRARIIPPETPFATQLTQGRDRERFVNHLLVDGLLRGAWWIEREPPTRATLIIRPLGKLSRAEREDVAHEAQRMLVFAADQAELREVRFG